MTTPVQTQLDDLARRVAAIEVALELRRPVATPTPEPRPAAESLTPVQTQPRPRTAPWPPAAPSRPPREPRPAREPVDLSGLLGAKALAIAGGVVTLLGIVFFFILAVDRGWIGPAGRVALGGAASAILFAAGLELRRRFGTTHAALAAVGAGIAGAYTTLLAATALYHLVPTPAALVGACAIAAVGVFTAISWRSELVACLGLIGAVLAPAALAVQDGISPLGTGFAALVFAATAVVAFRHAWMRLLQVGAAASAPQIVALVLLPENHGTAPASVVALSVVFSLLFVAAGIVHHLRLQGGRVTGMTTLLVFGGGVLAALSAYRLFATPEAQGIVLLTAALAFAALAAAFVGKRDLGALLVAAAFTLGALAFAALLSGSPLAYAWAAESAAVAWLAYRTKEIRFRLWSTVYVALAVGHVLGMDAPPRELFSEYWVSASGAPAAAAVAAAFAVYAWLTRTWPARPGAGALAKLDSSFASLEPAVTGLARWLAGMFALYAASLGIVGLAASFDWAHVAVAALWSLAGLGLVLVATGRGIPGLLVRAEIWLGTSTVIVIVHGAELADTQRAWSYAVAAAALLAAAFAAELRPGRPGSLDPAATAGVLVSQGLAVTAALTLLDGRHQQGGAVLALGALFAGLAAALYRRPGERDFVTLLWGSGAMLTAAAAAMLLDGAALVVAWSAAAASLALLLHATREERFIAGACGFAGLAAVHMLALDAPLSHLFGTDVARGGTLAALAVAGAVAAIAAACVRGSEQLRPAVARAASLAGVLAVYGLSIAILRVTASAYPSTSPEDAFHTGHTVVSAFWGLLGLGLLYAGLTRWGALRLAGFAVFAVALGKLFLFDLSFLSSITRALSFLAVGAVLLAGGFFYQRLANSLGR